MPNETEKDLYLEKEISKGEGKFKNIFDWFDELKKQVEKNEEIEAKDKMETLSNLSEIKMEVAASVKEDPEKFGEILKKLDTWKPKKSIIKEAAKESLIGVKEATIKDIIRYYFSSQLAKFDKINPSPKLREFVDKLITQGMMTEFKPLNEMNELNLTEKEIELLGNMIETEETVKEKGYFGSRKNFIEELRELKEANVGGFLSDNQKIAQILLDKEQFEEIKKNLPKIREEIKKMNADFNFNWYKLEDWGIGKKENTEMILQLTLQEIEDIKKFAEKYHFEEISGKDLLDFKSFEKNIREGILSEDFEKMFKDFNLKAFSFESLKNFYEIFSHNKEILSEKGEMLKKIISDFGIKEIGTGFRDLLSLSKEEIEKIGQRDFSDPTSRKKLNQFIINSSIYQEVSSKLVESIKKAKGDYQAKVFPKSLLKYLSSSLFFSYLSFEKPQKEILEKVKGKDEEMHKKILSKNLEIKDIVPGKKAIKRIIDTGNIEYFLAAQELDISFDLFGIFGNDIESIKQTIDKKAEEFLENYSQNKEKFLPQLGSLLGYASKYEAEVNEIFKIENLWDFKFSHLEDLNSILSEVSELKMEIGEQKKEDPTAYFQNMEDHLNVEKFTQAREKLSLIEEKHRERALGLVEKMEKVIEILRKKEIPERKDVDTLLSNKNIFKNLGLSLSLDSLWQVYQKINQKEEKEEFLKSVEILKKPEEYLGAMNMEPSCMRVGGGTHEHGALVICEAPILILGIKDNFGKIKGRSLLIPVKDKNNKWKFELKNTYGVGREYIENFAKEIERNLMERGKDYYKDEEKIIEESIDGSLPKSKKIASTKKMEFYRDGKGSVELEVG